MEQLRFEDFQLDPDVLDGIHAMGFQIPTPIQEKAIPVILEGKDIIGCAQTGTGKTAAFMLPILHKIMQLPSGSINTLILVPTRELAIQIDQQVEAMSYFLNVKSIAVYGGGSGSSWIQQQQALIKGTDIIIATPGRLLAQMQMMKMDFSDLQHLVLDEADRMLDMGFYDDIVRIVNALPKKRQTLCFSATMPPKIRSLAKQILFQPEQINIALAQPAEKIKQSVIMIHEDQKMPYLEALLREHQYRSVIIFSSSKEKVKRIERALNKSGIAASAFHSDLSQEQREELMLSFKNRKVAILVATDILSRGIHVDGIELVLNYDVPGDPEDYIHRIGRTARAAEIGSAVTFVQENDQRRFARIEKLIKATIDRLSLPPEFGPAPEYNSQRFQRSSHHSAPPAKKFKKKFKRKDKN